MAPRNDINLPSLETQAQNAGTACSRQPPSRTAPTRTASPVAGSVSTATAQSVAGPVAGSKRADEIAPQEALQRLVLGHADHRIEVAGHADVAHERGAAGQHAQIGGRHVGVGADDEARAAVAEKSHRLLFAGRLAVEIDDDGVGAFRQRAGGELAIDRRERIVERVHVDAAHGVDDEHARAVLGLDHGGAAARRAGGIIDRPDQPRRALDEDQRLFLVPGMIAERDGVDAGLDQLAIDRLGDAEAAGRILAIGHDQIELPVAHQLRQALDDDSSPAAADNVADEKNAHAHTFYLDHLALR